MMMMGNFNSLRYAWIEDLEDNEKGCSVHFQFKRVLYTIMLSKS
jgi:hypothetical protein